MTQTKLKRVTQKGTQAVGEQWRGSDQWEKELRWGREGTVREGARVSGDGCVR